MGLAEKVDELQDAGSGRDMGILAKLLLALVKDATRFGYPPLEAAALSVHAASEAGKDDEVEAGLVELTAIARRIRLGHRGAS